MSDVDQFPPIIKYDALEARLGRVVGEGGQSQAVALLGVQDQWLAKLYRIVLGEQETVRLDRLIALPDQFSTEDRTLSLRTTSWPVARVADGHDTVGVVIPRAPSSFTAQVVGPSGRRFDRLLTLDWLALEDEQLAKRGICVPAWRERLLACRDIVAVADLFERYGIVYGDWNYSNALWSPTAEAAYVVDIDSCSFGPQPDRHAVDWDDPTAKGVSDTFVDRYRVALLIFRCLTGRRDAQEAIEAVRSLENRVGADALADVGMRMLDTTQRIHRPPAKLLLDALTLTERLTTRRQYDMSVTSLLVGSEVDRVPGAAARSQEEPQTLRPIGEGSNVAHWNSSYWPTPPGVVDPPDQDGRETR